MSCNVENIHLCKTCENRTNFSYVEIPYSCKLMFQELLTMNIQMRLITSDNINTLTNINTNLLFFEKGSPTKEVWYYQHLHPVGVKNYNKTVLYSVHFNCQTSTQCGKIRLVL